jgi:hypothetical protein
LTWEEGGQPEDEPEEPELAYLWRWFCSLNDWREQGWGMGPLSHVEMDAWARLMRIDILPIEVEALRRLDRVAREHHQQKDQPQQVPISEQLKALSETSKKLKEAKEPKRGR